jgi:hypothetical protein
LKKAFLILFILFALSFSCFFAGVVLAVTGTIDSTNKYAWGDKCGWINFAPTNGNITITDSAITGYAWNEIYGWINFAPTGSGVTNTTSGVLSGYAWGENIGWINFGETRINCSGKFTGTATGDTVGTITFDCSNCNVTTNWLPSSGCSGSPPPPPPEPVCGDSVCNGTETCSTCPGDCGQCSSVCGDGVCDGEETCDTCLDDCGSCNHNECDDNLKCVSVEGGGIDECSNDIDCGPTYNACVLQQCVVLAGVGADQCQKNEDCLLVLHNECSNNQCVQVEGSGINQCELDSDCITPKHNECNQQKQCVVVDGLGSDTCQTDNDCNVVVPPSGQIENHNECNSQKQCVLVSGAGADLCKENNDCAEKNKIIEIVETPVKIIENTTQAVKEQIPEPVKTVAKEVKKIIETPQGSATTKTISTAGAVVATAQLATAIAFSPLEIFFILIRLWGILMTALGIRKRTRPWGVVYDSVTKQPIDPAYVILKNTAGKEVSSAITDLDGRFGFLVAPGIYQLSASKTNYLFPSQKLSNMIEDEIYNNLYFGGNIEIKQDGEAILKNIPMDPLKFDWNEFAKKDKKLMRFYSKLDIVMRKIFDIFFIVGFAVAIVAFFAAPYPYNLVILSIYLLLLLLRIIGVKPKAYGRIAVGLTGDPLSFAVLRVVTPGTNVEVAHKVADKYGRYYCLVPKGEYYVKIEKKNEDGSYSLIYTSPIINASKKGIIKNNFRV